jgi:hypothetical protein
MLRDLGPLSYNVLLFTVHAQKVIDAAIVIGVYKWTFKINFRRHRELKLYVKLNEL